MKNVIITGASKGIGRALVHQFSSVDFEVLALSRSSFDTLEFVNKNVYPLKVDITKEEDVSEIALWVKNSWNKVDILIHNAGLMLNKPFMETSAQDFLLVYQTNVLAVAELTRQLLPFMHSQSHVLGISSMGGIIGSSKFSGLTAYSSSKGALNTLMEVLGEEYKNGGPSFNALALGAIQTEMLEKAFPNYTAPLNPNQISEYIFDFATKGHRYFRGKVIPVSCSTP